MYKGGISSYAGFERASKAKQWLARSTKLLYKLSPGEPVELD